MNKSHVRFTYKPALESQQELIHNWLQQDYISDWIHGQGLQNTFNSLEKFFQHKSAGKGLDRQTEITQHWVFDDVPAGTLPGAGVTLGDAYSVLSTDSGNTFSSIPTKVSTMSFDPDAASGSFVLLQFMGDYTWVTDSPDGSFYYAWTDSRRGQTCPAVDAYRQGVGPYPDVSTCPPNFGRTDIFVANINSVPASVAGK